MRLVPEQLDNGHLQFRLERPSGESITVSEPELVALGQLVLPYLDQLRSRRRGQRIVEIPVTNPDVIFGLDAHHTNVVIRFQEQNGLENSLRWSRFTGQFGGKAKMDFKFDYAASFSSFSCVA